MPSCYSEVGGLPIRKKYDVENPNLALPELILHVRLEALYGFGREVSMQAQLLQ